MALPKLEHRYTPEEYLALERRATYKSEYLDGRIVAMAGASPEHDMISVEILGLLWSQLRGRPCRVHSSDMRVKVSARHYTYPDISVVCGEAQYGDAHGDTLTNPTVLIEVLSPSTAAYDRRAKFADYRQLPSLREYLLVAQDRMQIEHYVRQGEDWPRTEAHEPTDVIDMPAIGCTLTLADIYQGVDFSAPANRRVGRRRAQRKEIGNE